MRSFFRSNNLMIDRFNRNKPIDTSGPILLSAASLSGFYYYNSGNYTWEVYVGYTLSATPAVWSAGTTILSAGWYLISPTIYRGFMSDINTKTYTVTESDALSGYRFSWREVVQKNGITKTAFNKLFKASILGNTPPGTNISFPVLGIPVPGEVLTKPARTWTTAPNTGPVSVSGVWYKNGLSTGVTLSTYSDTANGDLIQYRETATNLVSAAVRISRPIYINSEIPTVLNNLSANVISRVTGLSGGSKYMNMFSVKNHNTKTYVRNPDFWAYDIKQQFTGCVVYKTSSYESFGGVLITPRHVLYCAHAHPHALGTWPIDSRVGADLTFVRSDNTSLTAMQLHQQSLTSADLCVAVMDRDLQAEGLNIVKIADLMGNYESYYGVKREDYTDISNHPFVDEGVFAPRYIESSIEYAYSNVADLNPPLSARKPLIEIAVSQGYGNPQPQQPPSPAGDYPQQNDIMCHMIDTLNGQTDTKSISSFKYNLWPGDSGTPAFVIYNNELYLQGIMVSTPWGRSIPCNHIEAINQAIHQADLNAISMGRLTETTGYTVSATPLIQ